MLKNHLYAVDKNKLRIHSLNEADHAEVTGIARSYMANESKIKSNC